MYKVITFYKFQKMKIQFPLELLRDYDNRNRRMFFNMGGVGYDIANSDNLSECEKEHLIKSCEDYAFKGKDFSQLDKHLLWKVRKCYHIQQMGLSQIAEPATFMDRLLY